MSYNIRNGVGLDGQNDISRIAKVINDVKPDIVAIQEVDSMTERSGKRYVLGELAEMTRMNAYYSPAIEYDGGKYGIGVLCRVQPCKVHGYILPGREESRAMVMIEFDDFVFCGTHFSLMEADQMESVRIMSRIVSNLSKPVFLAGDLNATPDSPVIKGLVKSGFMPMTDPNGKTYPADNPDTTLDYIMLKNSVGEKQHAEVIDDGIASDHRPVILDILIHKKE